jgi:hypothetical protein
MKQVAVYYYNRTDRLHIDAPVEVMKVRFEVKNS